MSRRAYENLGLGLGLGLGLVGVARWVFFIISYIGLCPTWIGFEVSNIQFFEGTVGSPKTVTFELWFFDLWKKPKEKIKKLGYFYIIRYLIWLHICICNKSSNKLKKA